jgi:hypothetical protein
MPKGIEKLRDLGEPELETRERELAEQIFGYAFSSPPARPKRSAVCGWPEKIWRGSRPFCASAN